MLFGKLYISWQSFSIQKSVEWIAMKFSALYQLIGLITHPLQRHHSYQDSAPYVFVSFLQCMCSKLCREEYPVKTEQLGSILQNTKV